MHPITASLQQTYNTHAKHFSQTRKKHRPEIDHIIDYINTLPQKKCTILELGCGDGRLYTYLCQNTQKTIHYTGVDIADKLLDIAKKNNPDAKFIHADMIDFVQRGKQESLDIVISIAAFHHIPSKKDRYIVTKNIYRLLKYEGSFMMTNWALSKRFVYKYRKQMVLSITQRILSYGQKSRRDVYITRNRQSQRYYHIFSKKHIERICKQSGFNIRENTYITTKGNKSQTAKQARNILTICKKSI